VGQNNFYLRIIFNNYYTLTICKIICFDEYMLIGGGYVSTLLKLVGIMAHNVPAVYEGFYGAIKKLRSNFAP
jgi:hypothetical protein